VSAGRFQPVAFRGTLTVALVLAMADTGAMLWLGLVTLLRSDFRQGCRAPTSDRSGYS
jgi:hypothetical protein